MSTILSRDFSAVPSIPFQSEDMRLPDGARAVWIAIESDQNGTLHMELWNPEQERWSTFSSVETSGGTSPAGPDGTGTTPGIADITVHDIAGNSRHRVRWMPDAAASASFVNITYGISG